MNEELYEQRIDFRIAQARETLEEADALLQRSLFRGAINRAYYAMFYSTMALSVLKGRVISKHGGMISFFDQEFVRTGLLPKELSKALHLAFDRRQSNDYGEVWQVDQVEAESIIFSAKEFVDTVAKYIDSTKKSSE